MCFPQASKGSEAHVMKRLLALTMSLISCTAMVAQNGVWQLRKQSDGISVYTRPHAQSDLEESLAEMTVDLPVSTLVAELKQADEFEAWMPLCKRAQLLKVDGDHQYHYQELSVPFPLDNRDAIVHYHYIFIANGIKVAITAAPTMLPEKEGLVRIDYLDGNWLFERVSDSQTKVTYQIVSDPGGSIPAWLSNTAAVDNPFDMMVALRRRAMR
jgi:hypothetical protein